MVDGTIAEMGEKLKFISDLFYEIDDFVWNVTVAFLVLYLTKVVLVTAVTKVKDIIHSLTLKYDIVIMKFNRLNHKIDALETKYEDFRSNLEELKKKNEDLTSDMALIRMYMRELQVMVSNLSTSNTTLQKAPTIAGGPPPPPPPPPPFSLVTPAMKIVPSTSKTDIPKKKAPTGPPQFSISQADITRVLQRLKKTSSTAKLLGSEGQKGKKTPPRRKLFGRTPGHSRRRSITMLSPRSDYGRQTTPLSSHSPSPKSPSADFNGNQAAVAPDVREN